MFYKSDALTEKLLKATQQDLVDVYLASLKNIKAQLSDFFEKFGENIRYADAAAFGRLANLERQIIRELNKANVFTEKAISGTLRDIYQFNYYHTGFGLESALKVNMGFGLLDTNQILAAVVNPIDKIKWTDSLIEHKKELEQKIARSLSTGLIEGKGYVKIATEIGEHFGIDGKNILTDKGHAYKILRIVRTEGHRTQQMGNLLGFEELENNAGEFGLKTKRIWVATLDAKTRQDHGDMDGREANDEGYFELPDGSSGKAPGLIGVAKQDINCRCITRLELEGFVPKKRRIRGEGIQDYKNFNQWYNEKITPVPTFSKQAQNIFLK